MTSKLVKLPVLLFMPKKCDISEAGPEFLQYFRIPGLKKLQPFLGLINSFHASAVTGAQRHRCFDESKDFFKDKLLQYGAGTKVPIRCLLWYYKDAPPQIQDIFGKLPSSTIEGFLFFN